MFRRSPPRLSSLALLAAQLLGLAGLYAADRAITHGARARVELDAAETAAFAEGLLSSHVQTLRAMRGALADSDDALYDRRISTLVEDLIEERLLFRRMWMSDSAGVVRYQRLFGAPGPLLPHGVDIDTASALQLRTTTAVVRQTRQPAISTAGRILTGERGFSIVVPLIVGDQTVGFAGGTLIAANLLHEISRRRPLEDAAVAIIARGDTVAAQNPDSASERMRYAAVNTFHVPGGAEWQVSVARPARDTLARVAMWAIGLAMIGALSLALVRERREGRRVAERSTELERLSTELLRANRAKSEFLANVSHELRTPLNAIVGFVDLLRDGVYGELAPRQVNPVDRIAASAAHLRHLVDQILDIAKMAAGRMEMHPEPVDLRPFVIDVASEFEALIADRGLNLSLAIGGSLPRVRTDPTHLRQIIVNLLGNAVKYTPTGGIAVRARVTDERSANHVVGTPSLVGAPQGGRVWIALQIADSGIGIAPADLGRVFEEFEQVNAGPRGDSMQRGTGLGLPISRRLARLLGGDITVESELGKGSTFTVWIPIDAADLGVRTGAQTPTAAADPVSIGVTR
ncbi:MAG TPA: HAMP domain-containing sensor histidine kinase [Gemmatimonadaceae bacterium]|nr:HAMP domain-containing sensor histidine kinase [Gemmatimonadaceae bacterium]